MAILGMFPSRNPISEELNLRLVMMIIVKIFGLGIRLNGIRSDCFGSSCQTSDS
jgi:hypothetical protein